MSLEVAEGQDSASVEKNRIIEAELKGDTQNINGIRVMGLSKTYKSIVTRQDTRAL